MRRPIVRSRVALALLVVLAVLSARVRAQDLFYEAYQNGIKEFKADNLDAARRLFERALQLDSKQSRRRLFYGRLFSEYLPEYYLALISIKQRQPDRARAYLQNLEGAGLLKPGDPQHATLTAQLNAAAPAVTTNATAKASPAPPGPTETPPSTAATGAGRANASEQPARSAENAAGGAPGEKAVVSPPPAPSPASPEPGRGGTATTVSTTPMSAPPAVNPPAPKANAVDWKTVTADVNHLLDTGEFERAWDVTRRAAAGGGAAGEAATLSNRIVDRVTRAAETRLRERNFEATGRLLATLDRIAAGSPDTRRLRAAMDVQLASAAVERESLRNLMLGNYQRVVELTGPLVEGQRASERLLFYAACGHAGLSLVGAKDTGALRLEARRLFAEATRSRADFKKEEAYLSPEILGVLRAP